MKRDARLEAGFDAYGYPIGLHNISQLQTTNPLNNLVADEINMPGLRMLRLMTDVEYLWFTAKHLLNVTLHPMQASCLVPLWVKPMSMYIACRGWGKSFSLGLLALLKAAMNTHPGGEKVVIAGAGFRHAKFVFDYAENIFYKATALRSILDSRSGISHGSDKFELRINESCIWAIPMGDGCLHGDTMVMYDDGFGVVKDNTHKYIYGEGRFREVDYFIDNGHKPVKHIKCSKGYGYIATHNHGMKVLDGLDVIWRRTDEMRVGDVLLLDKSVRWHNGQDKLPEDKAYRLGLLFSPSQDSIDQTDISYWGIEDLSKFPERLLKADCQSFIHFLRGLFQESLDNFHTTENVQKITFDTPHLAYQMQIMLLHLGIICHRNAKSIAVRNERDIGILLRLLGATDHPRYEYYQSRTTTRGIMSEKLRSTFLKFLKVKTTIDHTTLNKFRDRLKKCKTLTPEFLDDFLHIYRYSDHPFVDKVRDFRESFNSIEYVTIGCIQDSHTNTYDMHVPDEHLYCANGFISHNSKIRGFRANTVICDEFNSVDPDIFDTVVKGFASVKQNPAEGAKLAGERAIRIKQGTWSQADELEYDQAQKNQIIIAGTPGYQFQNFFKYFKEYRTFINSKGDVEHVAKEIGYDRVPENFNYLNYGIVRVPLGAIPPGYMDEDIIANTKATTDVATFRSEYGALFILDSNGFYPRSLIEKCTTSKKKPIEKYDVQTKENKEILFFPTMHGNPNRRYIYGIDPASESDRFSLIILEPYEDHARIVHVWTITRKETKKIVAKDASKKADYYGYCARKIRDLMKIFPAELLAIDAGGGGIALCEALSDEDKLEPGERPLYEVVDDKKEKPTDDLGEEGDHIIHLIHCDTNFLRDANYGLKKDLEDQAILFPAFDQAEIAQSYSEQAIREQFGDVSHYDTLEDCVLEIEDLKNELCTIVVTATPTGREKWDVPQTKNVGNAGNSNSKKDRYSSLLFANYFARAIRRAPEDFFFNFVGGLAGSRKKPNTNQLYEGGWYNIDGGAMGIVPKNNQ